jgi:folate-dependent phosphoribosylglycinamide formyltransferase PurN
MNKPKMRVILLTHGQCEAVLEGLLRLERAAVVGVFVETDIVRRYSPREALRRSIMYEGYRATLKKYAPKLLGLGNSYDRYMKAAETSCDRLREIAATYNLPLNFVANFHTDQAIALMRAASPDLGVICGTNIIKESVFRIPRLGSINLHQGLAPYYRGGPPVFWELFNGESEIGITVHFVEPKVDTGQIILQETVPLVYDHGHKLDYDSFIAEFSESIRERSANLLAETVRLIAHGAAQPRPQDTSLGKRYRLPTKREKDELRRRLRKRELGQHDIIGERPFETYQRPTRSTDEASSA